MSKDISVLIRRIYYSLPPWIMVIFKPVIDFFRDLKYYLLPVYLFKGKEKTTGEDTNVAFFGWDLRIASYLLERFLFENHLDKKIKKILIWRISKYFINNKLGIDLAIVELNIYTTKFAKSGTGYLIPRWIDMQLITKNGINKETNKTIKKRIKKYSLTFSKGYTETDFKFFYERMYMPYILKRHSDSAVQSSYGYFLSKFRKKGSGLGFILKENKPVAGSFTEFVNKKIRMSGMGILDGREDILKMGVAGAIYYFEMLDCIKSGIESLNIGGTSPILTDGLTRFKLALGAKLIDSKHHGHITLWLSPLKNTNAVKNILKLNPFIFCIHKKLFRALFIDPAEYEDKLKLDELLKYTHCENIKETFLYCFGNSAKINNWINEEKYPDIQVLNYSNSISVY